MLLTNIHNKDKVRYLNYIREYKTRTGNNDIYLDNNAYVNGYKLEDHCAIRSKLGNVENLNIFYNIQQELTIDKTMLKDGIIVEWDQVGANGDFKLEIKVGDCLYSGNDTSYNLRDINNNLEDIHGNKIIAIYKSNSKAESLKDLLTLKNKNKYLILMWSRNSIT